MAKRIEAGKLQAVVGTLYPPPFDEPCRARERTRLGDAAGLTQFGVNLLRLPPGRLVEPAPLAHRRGRVRLCRVGRGRAGHRCRRGGIARRRCAGFKADDGDGHHLQNRSGQDAVVLEIGSRVATSIAYYSDIDMMVTPGVGYTHRDGTPYPKIERRGP